MEWVRKLPQQVMNRVIQRNNSARWKRSYEIIKFLDSYGRQYGYPSPSGRGLKKNMTVNNTSNGSTQQILYVLPPCFTRLSVYHEFETLLWHFTFAGMDDLLPGVGRYESVIESVSAVTEWISYPLIFSSQKLIPFDTNLKSNLILIIFN